MLVTKAVARHSLRAATADTPFRDHTHQRARQPEHQNPKNPPEPRHRWPCLAVLTSASRARHRRHGVTVTATGLVPTGMSVGFLVLVFESIVDTESPLPLTTKTVLPSGVTAIA